MFDGVWERILKVIEEAGKRGVGVLIDLHAGVGGQNGDGKSSAIVLPSEIVSNDLGFEGGLTNDAFEHYFLVVNVVIAHCGISTGKSKLFSSSKNQDLTILCLRALAANLAPSKYK